MAVAIRLSRQGRIHRPFYRVVAIDSRRQREGKAVEVLGTYDPNQPDKNIQVEIEKVHAWLLKGAQYSDAVASLLKKAGYEVYPAEVLASNAKKRAAVRARRQKRKNKDGKTWSKPKRRALKQHEAKQKAGRMAELAKAQEAAAAAKAAEEAKAAEAEAEAPAEAAE